LLTRQSFQRQLLLTFFQRAPWPKIVFYSGYLSASLHPGPFLESFLATAGVYYQRHPERTVFYRVFFHYFEKFLLEYEKRFEREYGYLRPVIQEVVNKYLDYGNPKFGFARIRCPECGTERLLTFSCKVRGFCPSCHAKHREEWGKWMRESLILDVPHRQVVFTIPKMLRIFFKYNRSLLSALCLCGKEAILKYLKAVTGKEIVPGIIAVIQSFGSRMNFHPHLHFLCRTTSPISNCPTGTFDGSRRDRRVLLRPFMTAFCRFERRSLSYS